VSAPSSAASAARENLLGEPNELGKPRDFRATNEALTRAFAQAQMQLLEELGSVKLSEVAQRALAASKRTKPGRCRET